MQVIGNRYRWALFVGGFLRECFQDGDESRFRRLGLYRTWDQRSSAVAGGRLPRAELVDLWRYTKSEREAV